MSDAPAPEPSPPDASARAVEFPCRNCGARMQWDPDRDALACEHCSSVVPVPRADGQIVERPLAAAGEAARGLGSEMRALRCSNCGATVELDAAATADACVFCGSASVLPQQANRNLLRPESLVPLDVGRATVEANFKRWIQGLWFRPNALRNVRGFAAVGVYVPYWTFDARVHSDWSADAGYYYYETIMVPVTINGRVQMRPQRVQKVRWVPAWGQRDDAYDDVLVHASRGVSQELASALGAWDLSALVPYRPEYLAGWRAEEYQLDLESGWKAARESIAASQRARCAGDVPGDTHRNLSVHNELSDVRWKHVLLPLWSLTYQFQGRSYAVLLHGQTGKVHGQAPLSWVKILALVLGVLFVIAAIALAGALAN